MPLIETKGVASAQGFGEFAQSGPVNYIEDVFSTYLYTGNGSTQTITNGIDLAGEGGLVWYKSRSDATDNELVDTIRGGNKYLQSNATSGEGVLGSTELLSFFSNGFSIGGANYNGNRSAKTYASWTFRKQPKFFDVVTWTGNSVAGRQIPHSLGSVPGCIIVKSTNSADPWWVYHRSTGNTGVMILNTTSAFTSPLPNAWNNTDPTATVFTVGSAGQVNQTGQTYVAYLFAHNAGGFGLSESDNVISCGSFTANGSGVADVNLGYEPQWILFKPTSLGGSWQLLDTMRGWSVPLSGVPTSAFLYPNTSGAETSLSVADGGLSINATGFGMNANDGNHRDVTFIYIAIRRGPMKVPTSGTSVYQTANYTGTASTSGAYNDVSSNFPVDWFITANRTNNSGSNTSQKKYAVLSRLTGNTYLITNSDVAENTPSSATATFSSSNNVVRAYYTGDSSINFLYGGSGVTYNGHFFRRAPGFFDEVCYTGDGNLNTSGSVYNVTHNLTVLPELVIIKRRNSSAENWLVACALNSTQWVNGPTTGFALNRTDPAATPINFSSSSYATTTTFRPAVIGGGYSFAGNDSGGTYVAYLFATCAGVSKVGSYTGTGTTKQIDCGFTGGARFVLIKRTDSTGDWYVWDTARGIVSGNDPYLLLNSTAAEVTGTDYVDTYSAGFEITSTAPAAINANGGTFIFLAIA